jgi:hypothetical protein
MLLRSAFCAVETHGQVFTQELTPDDIVGRAYSMSVTSPEALGEHRTAFEVELRNGIAGLAPDQRFSEIVEVEAMLGFRSTARHQPR